MITVTVYQKSNKYVGFQSKGHAGYAKEGRDIICAAISVLTVNTVNSIEAFTTDTCICEQDDGYIHCMLTATVSDSTTLLMKSLVLGIQSIQENYGSKYINLRFEEV